MRRVETPDRLCVRVFVCGADGSVIRKEKNLLESSEMEGERENIQVEVLFSQHIQQGSGVTMA